MSPEQNCCHRLRHPVGALASCCFRTFPLLPSQQQKSGDGPTAGMGVLELTPSAAESLISSPRCLSAPPWADHSGGVLGEHSPRGGQSATECMLLTPPALRGLDSGSPTPGDLQQRDGEVHLQPLPFQAAASRVLPPLGLEWETHLPGGWGPVASTVSLLLSLPASNWLSVLPDPLSSAEPRGPPTCGHVRINPLSGQGI